MKPLAVTDHTLASALGVGRAATLAALRDGRSGLARKTFETAALDTWIGEVEGVDAQALPPALADFDCRNNRLAWLGLQADGFAASVARARARFGPRRIGVFLGTSTSGILQTELAYRRRDPATGALPADFRYAQTHNTYSVVDFTRRVLELEGPSCAVSTACSSSAKVFGHAARLIELGVIDAAVVGGVDSLCLTTLYGFNSLELLSDDICRPWDAQRHGLSLGEAAAFALLERDVAAPQAWLRGVGESSDGFHMSSPHPQAPVRPRPCRRRSPRLAWCRARSTTSTCTAPRRPTTTVPRTWPCARYSATGCPAARPRAPPGTRWARPAAWRRRSRCWHCSTA
ncbi:3-oxoacyl-[acyl-carrier-protein] synthase 2 [Methylibium sp. T29-B]|nr:3-oxoacyl-[acyl-carrier-protein] synthase 2 [Methylibium sp. T29-B]